MRRTLSVLAAILASAAISFAANLALIPSSPQFNEPSQLVGTLNALITQMNGLPGPLGTPPGVLGLGVFCSASGGTPQTCNGQRGSVAWTGLTSLATDALATLVINDSSITATSSCTAQWNSAFAAGSAMNIATVTPTAGVLTIIVTNTAATASGSTTGTMGFNCFN